MTDDSERAIRRIARRAASDAGAPLLLAVSGGLDSMTLLSVMAAVARPGIAAVATFDHGTGAAATRAARHVEETCRRLGLPVVCGHIGEGGDRREGLEAMWRHARLAFLRNAAASLGARVVTAHTRDDQVETVLIRALRGSGARGLAGLAAASDLMRPFLTVPRASLERYAMRHEVGWVEDPSNASTDFLRNRVRREILPALRRADPHIDAALLATGANAAAWRAELEAIVDRMLARRVSTPRTVFVATSELAGYDRDSVAVLWPALAGRVGLTLDRRGTRACTAFTIQKPRTGWIPLAGGWRLEARGDELIIHRPPASVDAPVSLPADGVLDWGRFRFTAGTPAGTRTGWSALLPAAGALGVRAWSPGDRFEESGRAPRRVKRYLSDAGVRGSDRIGWPVVTLGDEVVWIPGVRRSDAAAVRSGGPARHFICELRDG